MNILEACKNKEEPKALAFMKTAMYWMLGREYLLAMDKSADSWTAACIDIMKSINGGAFDATAEQQENLTASLGEQGVAYLFAVDAAINTNKQYPPGTGVDSSQTPSPCALVPQVFGNFAEMLAFRYKSDLGDAGSSLAALMSSDWTEHRTTQSDDPAYQPVAPYGNPKGIDPGKEGLPVPKDDAPPPAADAKKTNWTPWLLGGAAVVGVAGVAYLLSKGSPKGKLAAANPTRKPKRFTLAQLKRMPTIEQGHMDNLKYNDGTFKVWLSRMTKADGMPYDHQVTVEKLQNGVWTQIETYRAR